MPWPPCRLCQWDVHLDGPQVDRPPGQSTSGSSSTGGSSAWTVHRWIVRLVNPQADCPLVVHPSWQSALDHPHGQSACESSTQMAHRRIICQDNLLVNLSPGRATSGSSTWSDHKWIIQLNCLPVVHPHGQSANGHPSGRTTWGLPPGLSTVIPAVPSTWTVHMLILLTDQSTSSSSTCAVHKLIMQFWHGTSITDGPLPHGTVTHLVVSPSVGPSAYVSEVLVYLPYFVGLIYHRAGQSLPFLYDNAVTVLLPRVCPGRCMSLYWGFRLPAMLHIQTTRGTGCYGAQLQSCLF